MDPDGRGSCATLACGVSPCWCATLSALYVAHDRADLGVPDRRDKVRLSCQAKVRRTRTTLNVLLLPFSPRCPPTHAVALLIRTTKLFTIKIGSTTSHAEASRIDLLSLAVLQPSRLRSGVGLRLQCCVCIGRLPRRKHSSCALLRSRSDSVPATVPHVDLSAASPVVGPQRHAAVDVPD